MPDQLPSAIDPVTNEDWTVLQFLQAVRVDLQGVKDSLAASGGTFPMTATATSPRQISVEWTAPVDVEDLEHWTVRLAGVDASGNVGTSVEIPAFPDGDTSHVFDNLVPGTNYTVTAIAHRMTGDTLVATTQVTTLPWDVTLTATVLNADSVRLNWTTTRTDINGWNIETDGKYDFGYSIPPQYQNGSVRTTSFSSLVAGFTYTFRLTPMVLKDGTTYSLPPALTVQATPA